MREVSWMVSPCDCLGFQITDFPFGSQYVRWRQAPHDLTFAAIQVIINYRATKAPPPCLRASATRSLAAMDMEIAMAMAMAMVYSALWTVKKQPKNQ